MLNVSKLTGMTAAIFEDIVKLTFIGDEKQGANPLLPAAVTHNASEVKGQCKNSVNFTKFFSCAIKDS